MRKFTEPTARNLLRKPLVLGVPLHGLIPLAFAVMAVSAVFGNTQAGTTSAIVIATVGYGLLRVFSRFAKSGWEESLLFPIERWIQTKDSSGVLAVAPSTIEIIAPDTLDEADLLSVKDGLRERLMALKSGERMALACSITESGAKLSEISVSSQFRLNPALPIHVITQGLVGNGDHIYSLCQLPVTTDPVWLFGVLSRLTGRFNVFVTIQGVNFHQIKRRIESSRRSSAKTEKAVSDIDSEVTFEESSRVLKALSMGDESVVEISLVIASDEPLDLDDSLFCEEGNKLLSALSILGIRRRFHRSHFVRAITACDLIPNILDPEETGVAILTTPRGKPLYFSPQDPRLEALHWLVVGATGSGKSFFTGLILRRMIQAGTPMSVLFVDHNRSFRRVVRNDRGLYLEPKSLDDVNRSVESLFDRMNERGQMAGIELSDLNLDEKKSATYSLLSKVEAFLRQRNTTHTIYVVLDECWNFMRDEPVLVQRAFREFRKLNGAAIAITQSLSDFLTDQSGQSIFQNAPIRILLRQGEDLSRYQGLLGLNSVELAKVRFLKQQKGVFSECLVKTPFLSRFGRLYPLKDEHDLFRTDNLRAELINEARSIHEALIEKETSCELLH